MYAVIRIKSFYTWLWSFCPFVLRRTYDSVVEHMDGEAAKLRSSLTGLKGQIEFDCNQAATLRSEIASLGNLNAAAANDFIQRLAAVDEQNARDRQTISDQNETLDLVRRQLREERAANEELRRAALAFRAATATL